MASLLPDAVRLLGLDRAVPGFGLRARLREHAEVRAILVEGADTSALDSLIADELAEMVRYDRGLMERASRWRTVAGLVFWVVFLLGWLYASWHLTQARPPHSTFMMAATLIGWLITVLVVLVLAVFVVIFAKGWDPATRRAATAGATVAGIEAGRPAGDTPADA